VAVIADSGTEPLFRLSVNSERLSADLAGQVVKRFLLNQDTVTVPPSHSTLVVTELFARVVLVQWGTAVLTTVDGIVFCFDRMVLAVYLQSVGRQP